MRVATVSESASSGPWSWRIEQGGFEVTFATLFDRPTPLDGPHGARTWMEQFRGSYLDKLSPEDREAVLVAAEDWARPVLYGESGWFADYRRLRLVARRLA